MLVLTSSLSLSVLQKIKCVEMKPECCAGVREWRILEGSLQDSLVAEANGSSPAS